MATQEICDRNGCGRPFTDPDDQWDTTLTVRHRASGKRVWVKHTYHTACIPSDEAQTKIEAGEAK